MSRPGHRPGDVDRLPRWFVVWFAVAAAASAAALGLLGWAVVEVVTWLTRK